MSAGPANGRSDEHSRCCIAQRHRRARISSPRGTDGFRRYSRFRTLPRFASGGADTFGGEMGCAGGFGSSLKRICFKLRTCADDWRRSWAMLRVRSVTRASFSSLERSSAVLRAGCWASDKPEPLATSGTGPSRCAVGFDNGGLGASCFAAGAAAEAVALPPARSTKCQPKPMPMPRSTQTTALRM